MSIASKVFSVFRYRFLKRPLQITAIFILLSIISSTAIGQDIQPYTSQTGYALFMQKDFKHKKVKSVSETTVYLNSNSPAELINTFEFDKNGNIKQRRWHLTTGNEGRHYWQSDFYYDHAQQLKKATRFSSVTPESIMVEDYAYIKDFGLTIVSVRSGADTTVFRKYIQLNNLNGQPWKLVCFEPTDSISFMHTNKFDTKGQKIGLVITSEWKPVLEDKKGVKSKATTKSTKEVIPYDSSFYEYQYDDKGNHVEENSFYSYATDDESGYKLKYTFNDQNQLIQFRQMTLKDRVYVNITFNYDTTGLLTGATEYYPEEYSVKRYFFTYTFFD